MGRRIAINAENATLAQVERAKLCGLTRQAHQRLFAVELLLRGYERQQVADIFKTSNRSVQRWIKLFNERGIDGIVDTGDRGRPRRIERVRFAEELVPLVLHPEQCDQVHWTAVKFRKSSTCPVIEKLPGEPGISYF